MDAAWFIDEVRERTKWCDFPPLVTTCSDGDNGGWFRNTSPEANFWSVFYADLLDRAAHGAGSGIQPVFINEYLDRHGVAGEVTVRTGAWNTGWHGGYGFTQWIGSPAQRDALARVAELSATVHARRAAPDGDPGRLEAALWRILRAETSCNFYWGEAWVPHCHGDLDRAEQLLSH
jgi:4-alpha-glucanotransferase